MTGTTKPILFSAPMVRALLDDRKTQTRRVIKVSDITSGISGLELRVQRMLQLDDAYGAATKKFRVGYRLWVRETWAIKRFEPCQEHERDWQSLSSPVVRYAADGAEVQCHGDRSSGRGIYHGPVEVKRPSIFMPRWASRLTLIVTDVRVERLQDISETDAIAEGCAPVDDGLNPNHIGPARAIFETIWNHINGPEAWEANPWVAAYTFRVIKQNIDAIGGEA